jgi:hypothetical protein
MGVFEITAPDGKVYEIEGANAAGALAALQKHLGPTAPAAPMASEETMASDAATAAAARLSRGVRNTSRASMAGTEAGRVGQFVDDAVRATANGITFGLADKYAGGMEYLAGQAPSYDAGVKAERARTAALPEGLKIGGEAAGGLMTGIGAIKSGLTLAGRFGPSLLGRTFGYGLEGAGYGAAHGAGNTYSDKAADYLENAKDGGMTGALIGAGLPVLGTAAGAAYRSGAAFLGPRVEGVGRGGSAMLRAAAQADEAGLQALPGMGPEAMLVDAGPAMKGLGQGVGASVGTGTGEGPSRMVNALVARDKGTGQRLRAAAEENLGPRITPSRIEAELAGSRESLGPAYGQVLDDAGVAAAHGAPPMNVESLAQYLEGVARVERGGAQKAAQQVRGMLNRTTPADPGVLPPDIPVAPVAPRVAPAASPTPQAQSLTEFLASKGGLGPDAELEAIGALRHTVNVEGAGRRKLVKQGGLPLDYAREAAEEAGYLQGSHRGTSTVNDLLDAIDAEMRGNRLYPGGVQGSSKRANAARSEREQHEYEQYQQSLKDSGFPGDRIRAERPPAPPHAPQSEIVVPSNLDGSPDTLLNTRQAIDGMLATEADPNTIRILTRARQAVDAELANVPGLKNVDAQFAELSRQSEGLKRGSQVLDGGKKAIRPDELVDAMRRAALPQGAQIGPSAAPFRVKQGTRGDVDRLIGTTTHDLSTLERKLTTPYNTEKLGTVFGEENRDRMVKALMDNRQFRQSYQDIVQGSQTAQRQQSAKAMDGTAGGNAPIDATLTGIGLKTINLVAKAISGASNGATKNEIGNVLAKQGPEVQRMARALLESAKKTGENSRAISRVLSSPYWIPATSPASGRKSTQ